MTLHQNHNLVTIAIPTVNSFYLKVAIESAINQTFYNLEILIVNNASTNDEKKKIREICDSINDPRLKYFENDNQIPPVENWNRCLDLSNGSFFCILSDDDIFEPEYVETLYNLAMQSPNTSIFRTRSRIISETGEIINYTASSPDFETSVDFIWHRLSGFRNQYLSDFFVKTNVLKENNGFVNFKNAWCTDDATWTALVFKSGGIISTSKLLCNYRYSPLSITSRSQPVNKLKAIYQYSLWFHHFYKTNYEILLETGEQKMVELIPSIFNYRIKKMKRDALSQSKSFYILLTTWLKFKNNYELSFNDLIYSFVKKYKI